MKHIGKIIATTLLVLATYFINSIWRGVADPQIGTSLAIASVNGGGPEFYSSSYYQQHKGAITSSMTFIMIIMCLLIWRNEIKNLLKSNPTVTTNASLFMMMCMLLIMNTGCMKKYDVPEYIEVKPSETAFVIPLEQDTGNQVKFDSEKFFESKKVAAKRIQVPHRWNQTGRFSTDGEWIDTVRVIIVDRSPVTREWKVLDEKNPKANTKDTAIWIESADSVGFSMGWSCTAYIREEDAAKFLYWYPSGSLAAVMDNELRARVQQTAAEVAARYKLDILRDRKLEIADAVKADVTNFFAPRGITVTTVGMFGGMSYENPKIQESIDQTFITQQEKVNANSLLVAQADKNKRIEQEAMALAEAAKTKASGEAAGIELVNQALAKAANNPQLIQLRQLEVEKARIEKWTGTYPNIVSGSGANLWIGLGNNVETNQPK